MKGVRDHAPTNKANKDSTAIPSFCGVSRIQIAIADATPNVSNTEIPIDRYSAVGISAGSFASSVNLMSDSTPMNTKKNIHNMRHRRVLDPLRSVFA